MNDDPYFWTSIFEPQHLRIDGVDFLSTGAPTVGYAFSLLYDANRLMRRARRETVGALHGLHLKREVRHVVISSLASDQKVVVPVTDLLKLATEQAERVYRQHCVTNSAMTMDQITRSFADNHCQTLTDIKRASDGGFEHFRSYPEVVGCGEKTLWTKVLTENADLNSEQLQRTFSSISNHATYVLDDWLGDDLVYAQRNFLITRKFLTHLEAASLSGFTASRVQVVRSGKFPGIERIAKSLDKREFYRLDFGDDHKSDFFAVPHVAVYVSPRALQIFSEANLKYALFIKGSP